MELPELPTSLSIGRSSSSAVKPLAEISEWNIDGFALLEHRKVGWLRFSLPEPELEKLLDKCRRETVWLTNLITVVLLRANSFSKGARVATAVDIRRRVDPAVGSNCFGCYAGVVETKIPYAEDIWEHARLCAANQLAAKGTLLMPAPKGSILKLMMKSRIDTALEAGHFAGDCAVSNVGTLAVQNHYGHLTVDQAYVANRQLAGHYSVFLTVSIFAGKLDLSISFAEPLLAADNARRLIERIAEQLQNC